MKKIALLCALLFHCIGLFSSDSLDLNEDGLITLRSEFNVAQTVKRLKHQAKKQGFSAPLTLNYQRKAKKVGIHLPPTEGVFLFEKTMISKLILSNPRVTAQLPPEIVVYENKEGKTLICYFDPLIYGHWFHLENQEETLKEMSKALTEILRKAAHP